SFSRTLVSLLMASALGLGGGMAGARGARSDAAQPPLTATSTVAPPAPAEAKSGAFSSPPSVVPASRSAATALSTPARVRLHHRPATGRVAPAVDARTCNDPLCGVDVGKP